MEGFRKVGYLLTSTEIWWGVSHSPSFSPSSLQLEEQQTLEEAISVATAAMQQGAVTLEATESGNGC